MPVAFGKGAQLMAGTFHVKFRVPLHFQGCTIPFFD
jgi:hypothetical protein